MTLTKEWMSEWRTGMRGDKSHNQFVFTERAKVTLEVTFFSKMSILAGWHREKPCEGRADWPDVAANHSSYYNCCLWLTPLSSQSTIIHLYSIFCVTGCCASQASVLNLPVLCPLCPQCWVKNRCAVNGQATGLAGALGALGWGLWSQFKLKILQGCLILNALQRSLDSVFDGWKPVAAFFLMFL